MATQAKIQRNGFLILLAALAALLIALEGSGSRFWQAIIINLGMYIILVAALNLSNGFTGVFSLGHIGFMALGAYISAILTLPLDKKGSYLPDLRRQVMTGSSITSRPSRRNWERRQVPGSFRKN